MGMDECGNNLINCSRRSCHSDYLFPHIETQEKREYIKECTVKEAMAVVEAVLEMTTLYTQLMTRGKLWLVHSLNT